MSGEQFTNGQVGWIGVLTRAQGDVHYLAPRHDDSPEFTKRVFGAERYSSADDVMKEFEEFKKYWPGGFLYATCTPKFMVKRIEIELFDKIADATGEGGHDV